MTDWTAADLDRIGSAGELQITTRRADGSLRPYVPVWVVRVGDQLFARSWRGQAGTERDVTLDLPQAAPGDAIDQAYQAKYGRYGDIYVAPVTGPQATAATVQIKPADSDTGRNSIR
jgi:hypothetical protein